MMAQSTVLMAALLIITLSYCSAENVYCVTPTTTSCSSCPQNSTNCTTLSEYAQEAELYFTSNTTMVFLPGDHVLNTSITVANVASLTMRGEFSSGNRATIICNGPVGFSFTSMAKFKMYSLAFTSCNRSSSGNDRVASLANSSALFLYSTPSAELVNCSFHDNFCTALAVYDTNITLAENKFTHNQCACDTCGFAHGCGITAYNSNLTFTGNTAFLENSYSSLVSPYAVLAGAIWTVESLLHFNGTNNFIGNVNSAQSTLGGSGAIYATTGSFLSFTGISNFSSNLAHSGGGAIYADTALVASTSVSFNGTSIFINNSGDNGGAIYAQYNVVFSFIGHSIFSGNSACSSGGTIYALTDTSFSFTGDTNFSNNSAHFGGAITAVNTSVSFNGTTNLSANLGGAIYTSDNSLISFRGTSNMDNNFKEFGGAIYARDTTLMFEGTIHFTNNGDDKDTSSGGGMYLSNSVLSILPNTTVYWANNHATLGGAIYVDDSPNPFIYCTEIEKCAPKECFFQLPRQNLSNGLDAQFVFKNNSADGAGSVLYGGAVDNCTLTGLDSYMYSSGEVFDMLVHIDDDNTNSSISSDPFHICPCENNLPNCGKSIIHSILYPGETLQVSIVAVGQRNGTVAAGVRSTIKLGSLQSLQYLQQANNTCTTLDYTVFSLFDEVYLHLYEDEQCLQFGNTLQYDLTINLTCPPGFKISELTRSCICEQRLQRYTNSCNITSRNMTRDSLQQFWVGYDDQSHGLILNPLCPFDYCTSQTVNFSLNNTDAQCENNRSGLLCGACKEGYSLVLGTSQCRKCTNSHLALLVLFAVMGVALVFLLLVCKLTVATGTLSGLVFYANIVAVNRTIFLPGESAGALSVFIAWLNLDFGIKTCFFDGMDTYSKTWLQFVFPVYIWVLVGLMVLISHYSQRFAKLLGNNPVSVLATLILLSYTKILRTLIAAIYTTYLEYPTYNRTVWLYDANIDYLEGKHIPLFLVAVLVFLFLFLPYTLLLLFGQWLQAMSHLRIFSWVNRLKPFLDSYHAPYKAKHRYWPGLLLLLRFVLLLVFAFNPQQDPSINLLVILVGAGMLHMWAWVSGGVYKNWCVDALESSFMLNLIILAAATYHVEHSGGNQHAVWYTSVSIVLLSFIAILAYHIFQQVRHTKLCKSIPKPKFNKQNFDHSQDVSNSESLTNKAIPVTVTEVAYFDELREPLLEDEPQPHHYTA